MVSHIPFTKASTTALENTKEKKKALLTGSTLQGLI